MRQNNQAAIEYMQQGRTVNEVQEPKPEVWPLSILARKMKAGSPPHLKALAACFNGQDGISDFIRLTRKFLPKHLSDIMSQPRDQRVYRFCYWFDKQYFSLPVNTYHNSINELLEGIPVELMGMSYSAYHALEFRPGYMLLLSLVNYPYEDDDRDFEDDIVPFNPALLPSTKFIPKASDIEWVKNMVSQLAIGGKWIAPMGFTIVKVDENRIELREARDSPDVKETINRTLMIAKIAGIVADYDKHGMTAEEKQNGARLPLLDIVSQLVGATTVRKIPAAGWSPAELHYKADNTRFEGCAYFADWVWARTGLVQLDSSYDDCAYKEGYSEPIFQWTRNNVDLLTEQYPKVLAFRDKIDHVVDLLESDRENKFREMVEFLLSRPDPTGKDREMKPMFSAHAIECLNQETDFDEEGEEEQDGTGASERIRRAEGALALEATRF